MVIPGGNDVAKIAIALAIALALLPGCRNGKSDTQKEIARGEEQGRAIEEAVKAEEPLGVPDVLAPRFAPEASEMELTGEVVDNARVVQMIARSYEFVPNEIVVNFGEHVRLEINGDDTAHGFALWGYGINRRVEPNETVVVEFEAKMPGRFHFTCPVYCGPGCVKMRGDLYVKDQPREKPAS